MPKKVKKTMLKRPAAAGSPAPTTPKKDVGAPAPPPPAPKGGVEAKKKLDEKIKAFLAEAQAQGLGDSADQVAAMPWQKHFTNAEMSALWARLATKMNAADPDTRGAWGALNGLPMREGKSGKKRTVLWLALKYPGDWASRSTTFLQRVLRSEATTAKEAPKTKGELIQIHGLDETEDLIKRGFFESVMVRGVQHYVKVSFERENRIEKQNEESMKLTKTVGSDEVHALENAFEQFKLGMDVNWTSSGWSGGSSKGGNSHGGGSGPPALAGAGASVGDTKASERRNNKKPYTSPTATKK